MVKGEIRGGCLCGSVKYAATAEPVMVVVCHCKHCQKQSGTAFALNVAVPKSAVTIDGQLKAYKDTGDSGQVHERRFCPECGSGILDWINVAPDLYIIKAGTLDDTSWLHPKLHIYAMGRQQWVSIPDDAQKFPKMPPT
jgi:hypothetical protein